MEAGRKAGAHSAKWKKKILRKTFTFVKREKLPTHYKANQKVYCKFSSKINKGYLGREKRSNVYWGINPFLKKEITNMSSVSHL